MLKIAVLYCKRVKVHSSIACAKCYKVWPRKMANMPDMKISSWSP